MPPDEEEPKPSVEERQIIEKWIIDGAEFPKEVVRKQVDDRSALTAVRDHLKSLQAADRPYQRYLSLNDLHNNRKIPEQTLRVHRAAAFEADQQPELAAGDSDLLICGILIWSQVRGFGLAGDRVDESQVGARIGELGRVEMLQQMSDRAVGPRVRHRMDLHTQYPLLQIRQQVGLGAKQIAQQAAGVVSSGQLLAHDGSHRRLGAVGDHLHRVDQLLAAGGQTLELVGLRQLVPLPGGWASSSTGC